MGEYFADDAHANGAEIAIRFAMTEIDGAPAVQDRQRAGHYEVLGETYAKFEFFEAGWNPYSRFLDTDKVDLLLRRTISGNRTYREVQVKYGKLHEVKTSWERLFFDFTSWRFFKPDEFADYEHREDFYIAYVLARDIGYRGDIFVFPVREFVGVLNDSIPSGSRVKVYLSRCLGNDERWVLRKKARFDEVNDESCLDVSHYRRNFAQLAADATPQAGSD
jgi:hypothetical protein